MRPNEPWSNWARERMVQMGADRPFAQGAKDLRRFSDIRCSASTVRAQTEAAGAALVEWETAETAEILRTLPALPAGAARQQMSVDGAMVPLVRGDWREVRTVVIAELGAANDPAAAHAKSYFSRMTSAEQFGNLALAEVHRRGTDQAAVVAGVADGALWCQGFFDLHVPHAVRILDFAHALEHLSTVAQSVFGSGTAATSEWLGRQQHALRHGEREAVLAAIAALPVETAALPQEAAQVRTRELRYFSERREQLAYDRFAAAGLPIGSGIVESANKLVVEARLKGSGMHWSPDHVNPMLALCCALKSGRWDERWAALHLPRPAAVKTPRPPIAKATHRASTAASVDLPRQAVERKPTIVNGRPTKDHPWKRGRPFVNPSNSPTDC